MTSLKTIAAILLGYALASIASGCVVALAMSLQSGWPGFSVLRDAAVVTMLIAVYAAPPALVAILAGEFTPIRRLTYYCAVATAIGVALPILVSGAIRGNRLIPVGLLFGPAAGWIYWRVAVTGEIRK
jgi:hypothetical protein